MREESPLGHLSRRRFYLYCDTSKAQKKLELQQPLTFHQAAMDAYDWYFEQGMI